MVKLSTQPPKGTTDWLPEEFKIRQYIFNVWRQVCTSYGYQEYMTPIIESVEIYKVKSGEDIGGKELMSFTDKAGRELAIRPEMTPGITRIVSKIYGSEQKPMRYFSIANFFRNEKPQRGRNREFWQLNFDVFGSKSINSDIEIAQMALDIMIAFNPPANSFKLCINNRQLIEGVLEAAGVKENKQEVVRILDKWEKLSVEAFQGALLKLGMTPEQQEILLVFMSAKHFDDLVKSIPSLADNEGLNETREIIYRLDQLGYGDWVEFKPSVIRGFDYYDGFVFEVFDNHIDNNRAIFGGGRYNGLAEIFGSKSFPAVGCAPGDETIRLFLESWGLLEQVKESMKDNVYYLPVLDETLVVDIQQLAKKLRGEGKHIETSFEAQKINKALEFANKKKIAWVIILGLDEKKKGIYKMKNMNSGEEQEVKL